MTIELPLPDRRLGPNAKTHFAIKAKVTRQHREAAFFKTLGLLTGKRNLPTQILHRSAQKMGLPGRRDSTFYQKLALILSPPNTSIPRFTAYSLAFYLPDARPRDDDNLCAACKAYRDGIADALQVNDNQLSMASAPTIRIDREDPRLIITLLNDQAHSQKGRERGPETTQD